MYSKCDVIVCDMSYVICYMLYLYDFIVIVYVIVCVMLWHMLHVYINLIISHGAPLRNLPKNAAGPARRD